MPINKPAHPLERLFAKPDADTDAPVLFGSTGLGDLVSGQMHFDLPATVPASGPRTTMRPVADDYQPDRQGVTSGDHGYDSDVPTAEWQPDSDYVGPKEKVPPIAAPKVYPPVDVHIVPGPQIGVFTVAQMRQLFGATEQYSGALFAVDMTTIRQILPMDLGRFKARIFADSSLAAATTGQYTFAISASKDFPRGEYYTFPSAGYQVEILSTNEIWGAIVPLLAYDGTKTNNQILSVISETSRPTPLS